MDCLYSSGHKLGRRVIGQYKEELDTITITTSAYYFNTGRLYGCNKSYSIMTPKFYYLQFIALRREAALVKPNKPEPNNHIEAGRGTCDSTGSIVPNKFH